ncbi:uncharacterized protein KGF55_005791 [Candida pseudojiufengensis]|uniref:uncharacterized protein n=1 Tax=Candida pseudojiufengensis TaxID=497109 RepID=UPI002224AC93|nr:uncharacterized protein KGF55_005791 [Candida pseudojiufengensis]KAI5958448.1 hypothetical protein KGF55_005791 [Candida pseudojiufengensis]
MVTINHFNKNVSAHKQSIYKNLCTNLIRHEYIMTTQAKARQAQPHIEKFISKALLETKELKDLKIGEQLNKIKSLEYLQPSDKQEIGLKLIKELKSRYTNRNHGFTRIIKLEPRLGEDKAPMSIIELVDSKYQFKLWYTAKTVAKLQLQNIPLDDITKLNINKLIQGQENGKEEFDKVVEICKKEFFKDGVTDILDSDVERSLKSRPNMERHTGYLKNKLLISKKFKTKPRPNENASVIPESPFLKSASA